jgi:hypothetical protein
LIQAQQSVAVLSVELGGEARDQGLCLKLAYSTQLISISGQLGFAENQLWGKKI